MVILGFVLIIGNIVSMEISSKRMLFAITFLILVSSVSFNDILCWNLISNIGSIIYVTATGLFLQIVYLQLIKDKAVFFYILEEFLNYLVIICVSLKINVLLG